MQADLNKILDFVAHIEELELDHVEPLQYMTDEVNVLRKDEIRQDITHEEALKNAPDSNSDYFRVPQVKG